MPEPEPAACDPERCARLDAIVAALRRSPLAPSIRIFGSAADPGRIPRDIDAFADLACAALAGEALHQAVDQFLLLAVRPGNHGLFDPFLRLRPVGAETYPTIHARRLLCRNDHPRLAHWIAAENARALTEAGRAGIPLAQFDRVFTPAECRRPG